MAWHDVIKDEIQALRSNDTWSLVPFHPLMHVVGGYWVYIVQMAALRIIRLSWLLQALLNKKVLIILRLLVLLLNKPMFG